MPFRQTVNGGLPITIARNSFLNFITNGLLIIVGLWAIPIVVSGITPEKFGLLALIWAFLGYFSLLDFGIGIASTKFVAELKGENDENSLTQVAWTALSVSLLLGIVTATLLVAGTPLLVEKVFDTNLTFLPEAEKAFIVAAIAIPFMLLYGTIKGFQVAYQKFGTVNLFTAFIGTGQWIGAVTLIWLGYGFLEIVILTAVVRGLAAIAMLFTIRSLFPKFLDARPRWNFQLLKRLLSFGGWITLSHVIAPAFQHLDRFLIGALISLSAVAYYTVPLDALTRLLIIPTSITMTLFPAISESARTPEKSREIVELSSRSVRYVFFLIFPLIMVLVAYSYDILNLWMGKNFAENSFVVFQIVAIGFLFNALAQIPVSLLMGIGRPDIVTKVQMVEIPIMIGLLVLLVPTYGIIGASIVWAIRVIIDACLLFGIADIKTSNLVRSIIKGPRFAVYFSVVIIFSSVLLFLESASPKIWTTVGASVLYLLAVWFLGFDSIDRRFFLRLSERIFRT